ncbi:MAG: hypothetical protein KDC54_20485 [Lewinella sp.]|nr:hypothetical protein [Lewinella sp.]
MRTDLFPVFLLLVATLLAGCESATAVDVDQVIEDNVEERLAAFRAVLEDRCREQAVEEAGLLADSIILERARLNRDTTGRPPRPHRPDMPELLTIDDSVFQLRPLFDSLGRKIGVDTIPKE